MEQNRQYDIFISYRRLDEQGNISGRDQARLIAKQLELEGYCPFFDYSEVKDNEFDKVIIPAVENCKVFILVLTKDSLNRCKNEDDWVRKEIETAISSHCKLVNVTPDKSFNGWPDTLPKILYPIKNIQISEINMGSLFELSVKKLIADRIRLDRLNEQKENGLEVINIIKNTLNFIKILLLIVSVLIFLSFAVMDIGYNNRSFFVPYYEWLLGAYSICMILALIGYVKPQTIFCNSRKMVTLFFLLPFILLAIVGGNAMEEYEIEYKNRYIETSLSPNIFLEMELNKEMFCMYYGNPKTITLSSSNIPQPLITKFDRFGHVISKEYGNIKNIYIYGILKNGLLNVKGISMVNILDLLLYIYMRCQKINMFMRRMAQNMRFYLGKMVLYIKLV